MMVGSMMTSGFPGYEVRVVPSWETREQRPPHRKKRIRKKWRKKYPPIPVEPEEVLIMGNTIICTHRQHAILCRELRQR